MSHPHGMTPLRGLEEHATEFHHEGRFGRLFPSLVPFEPPDEYLIELGKSMDQKEPGDATGDAQAMSAGFTFLGQFVAHDITFDTTSALDRKNDPQAIKNFRTAGLDLDCVYGLGPEASPYLYDQDDKAKLLIGTEANPDDLQRNRQHVALIGDPRNDVSLITSQLHLLFLKFHNRVVDHLRDEGVHGSEIFEEAARLTRWHYQWILIWEYIPKLMGPEIIADVRANGRKFYRFKHHPFIPVEFTAAAFRFGHSQLRSVYRLNEGCPNAKIFSDLGAFKDVPPSHVVDWRDFFEVDPDHRPQPGRKIDTQLASEFHVLPFVPPDTPEDFKSLAVRNLVRGKALQLPSGQAVAHAMGLEPIPSEDMGLEDEAPLWFYILKEAEMLHDGERLGEVGGRIVAEVFHGFLKSDDHSYVVAEKDWKPTLPSAEEGHFTMADMVRFVAS